VTIASTGNSTDFGDLTSARSNDGAASSQTRGLWAGGLPGNLDVIDHVTISHTGNATDFGDLTVGRAYLTGLSSGNGGITA